MPQQQQLINQVVDRVNDFNKRVRDLEEKIRNLQARVNTLDETVLNKNQSLQSSIEELEDEVGDVRDRIANIEVDVKEFNREKRKFVTEQEIDEIESYMDLMNPLNSQFATKNEVKKLVKEHGGASREDVEEMVEQIVDEKQRDDEGPRRERFEEAESQ